MEVTAKLKFARISPKKVHPLLGDLRKKPAEAVLQTLRYARTKSGRLVYKLIASAVANAVNNFNAKPANLQIKTLVVDEGPRYKRYWFRSHGSADIRLKRMAHLSVVLEEILPVPPKVVAKTGAITTDTKLSSKTTPLADTNTNKPAVVGAGVGTPGIKSEKIGKSKRFNMKKIFTRTTNK